MPDKAFEKYGCRVHRRVCPVDDVLCLCLQRHLVTGCLSGMIPSGSFAPGAPCGAPGYCLEMPCLAFLWGDVVKGTSLAEHGEYESRYKF